MLFPVKELLLARRVEEAAVMVMLPEPSKATPLMFLGVARTVAEPAKPEIEPVTVFVTERLVKLPVVPKRLVEKRLVEVA